MTDWDAAVTSMAGVLGGDLRAAMAKVALARERPYCEAKADRAAAEAYHALAHLPLLILSRGVGRAVDLHRCVVDGVLDVA